MGKKLKVGKLKREFSVRDASVNVEAKTISFAFSSEAPVERFFGAEILSHRNNAPDLARLNNRAQVLFNHDWDQYIGVVERAWIGDDFRGYCEVKFAEHDFAQQIKRDIDAGILSNVSFGYEITSMDLTKSDGDKKEYTATKWAPYEVSFVTVPADASVGVGRAKDESDVSEIIINDAAQETAQGESMKLFPQMLNDQVNEIRTGPVVDVVAERAKAATAERERIETIRSYGEKYEHRDMAAQMIREGVSLESAREKFLEKIGARQIPVGSQKAAGEVDLSAKEQANYSLSRAILASMTGKWDNAGLELEASNEVAKRSGRSTTGFFIPSNLRAAYNTGVSTQGGALVATELKAESFIELLRNKALVMQLGARFLSGLTGNVALPRQATAAQAYWVTENQAITEDESMTFNLISLSPKTIAARSQMTRQMLQQGTPDMEMLVRSDIAAILALGLDKAALYGTGASGQPLGVFNQSGIGSVVGGTNGAQVSIDQYIDLETAVAVANADAEKMYYVTNAKVVGATKKLKSTTGQYLWTNSPMGQRSNTPGEINGYTVARTNQINSNGTKGTSSGVTSGILFGDFSQLVVGEWGILEVLANPYGAGYNSGAIDIRAMQTVDMNVRHPESFAAITDVLTA